MTKIVEVEITGECPLLQNRFNIEQMSETKKAKKKTYDPVEEANKTMHIKNGKVFEPSEHVLGCLIKAGTSFKFEGKKTFKDILARGIIISPDEIPLLKADTNEVYTTYDEIDTRPVVIQRARVLKWRAKYNNWKLQFKIEIINPDEIDVNTLHEILNYAGKISIGDYRPRFGRFHVTSFQEVKD